MVMKRWCTLRRYPPERHQVDAALNEMKVGGLTHPSHHAPRPLLQILHARIIVDRLVPVPTTSVLLYNNHRPWSPARTAC
jgi:hypothetical protein